MRKTNDFLIALRIWEKCQVAFWFGHLEHASYKRSVIAAALPQLT